MTNALNILPSYHEAMIQIDRATEPEQIRNRDVTQLFEEEIQKRHKWGYLLNASVVGEQATGKSLVAFTLTKLKNEIFWKKKMSTKFICTDQVEFGEKVKNTALGNCCMMIDEWNELSTTGLSATTVQAWLDNFMEVQAQRHIDRVAAAPEKILDTTARIILEVPPLDKKDNIARCLYHYIYFKEGIRIQQLLGFVDIDVTDSLTDKTWLAYRKRKFAKMRLLLDNKIIDNRAVEEAKIILAVINRMSKIAKECGIVNRDLIKNYVQIVQKKFTAISILGKEDLVSTIHGVLTLLKNITTMNNKIEKTEKALKKAEDPTVHNYIKEKLKIYEETRADLALQFQENMREKQNIIDVMEKFEKIDETTIKKGEKEVKGGSLK